jgi:glycosyltransferase involved in cell wall biosynthesis
MANSVRIRVAGGSPRISVVMPVYNGATTIERALASVLAQTYSAHELIVVDDGSRDRTSEIVQSYGQRVRHIRQENAGPSAARNRGVEVASGDWVAFLDADDWYYPNRLELHAQLIEANPELDFVVGNFDYRDVGEKLLRTSMSDTEFGKQLVERLGEAGTTVIGPEDIGRFIGEQFSDTRTLTVPRQKFSDLGGFARDLRICEDVVFLIRLCASSRRAGVTCKPSAVYSVHDNGLIRSDRYRAQTETVRALNTLNAEMQSAPLAIRDAWTHLLKRAHLNQAYFLAKQGKLAKAQRSILASFRVKPEWSDLRHYVSLLKG